MRRTWIQQRMSHATRALAATASAERTNEEDGLRLVLAAMALGMIVSTLF